MDSRQKRTKRINMFPLKSVLLIALVPHHDEDIEWKVYGEEDDDEKNVLILK